MDNAAFTRAARFLNYVPVAKWLSMLCGVATAVLYVGLLLVLALFADLMVNRGAIPALHNLPARIKSSFNQAITLPSDEKLRQARLVEWERELKDLGLEEAGWMNLAREDPANEHDRDLRDHLLWFAQLPGELTETVGDAAGQRVR